MNYDLVFQSMFVKSLTLVMNKGGSLFAVHSFAAFKKNLFLSTVRWFRFHSQFACRRAVIRLRNLRIILLPKLVFSVRLTLF